MKLITILIAATVAAPALAENPVVRQNQLRERVEAAEHRRHVNDNRVRHEFRDADQGIRHDLDRTNARVGDLETRFEGIESVLAAEPPKDSHSGLIAGAAIPVFMDLDRGLQVAGGFGISEDGAGFKGVIGYGAGSFIPAAFAVVSDDGEFIAGGSVTVAIGDLF